MKKKDQIIEARKRGTDYKTIARELDCNYDYVKEVCKENGLLYKPGEQKSKRVRGAWKEKKKRKEQYIEKTKSFEERKQMVLDLRSNGKTSKEIADILGYKSYGWINKTCRESGLGGTSSWKEKRYAEYRAYKAEGHTMGEVAEKFGISIGTANRICKGIAPQTESVRPELFKKKVNQYTSGSFDREANAIKYINERTPWFEYAGNFTGLDGFADLKCKTCGAIERKSFVGVRQGTASCTKCRQERLAEEREKREAEKAEQRKEEQREAEYKRHLKIISMKAEQMSFQTCKACGALFVPSRGRSYCSDECSKRASNSIGKDKRIKRIKGALVDKDIEIHLLYKRDRGVCALCGGQCDWNDYIVADDGTFIAGNNYPSIDHIVPLSRGGLHAWDNVQLAHRLCNSKKWANV